MLCKQVLYPRGLENAHKKKICMCSRQMHFFFLNSSVWSVEPVFEEEPTDMKAGQNSDYKNYPTGISRASR